jgi:hypothetical protein
MADRTTWIDTISVSQASKEVTANAFFDASSPGTIFGRRAATTTGLTWGYYGGKLYINGTSTELPDSSNVGVISLTASATNYIEVSAAGVVSKNTTGFSADKAPLYIVVTGASTVADYFDERDLFVLARLFFAFATQAMADANQTLALGKAVCHSIEATGALTALRDVILPTVRRQWSVFANTTGGFGVRWKTSGGSGITVADGKRAILECDGTNVVRVTADV